MGYQQYAQAFSNASSTGAGNNGQIDTAVVIPIRDVNLSKPHYKMSASGTTESVKLPSAELPIWSIPTSEPKYAPNVNPSKIQRDSSPLSGCGTNLAPNFGQGQTSVATTWPADGANQGVSDSVFLIGGIPHKKTVNYLTGSGFTNPVT